MKIYLGADIASVDGNKPIDWSAAFAAGLRFVFFRGSYNAWQDPTFNREAARARNAGLTVGAYLFPVFDVAAKLDDQVAAFCASVDLRPGRDFVPALDVEFPGTGIARTGHTREELADLIVSAAGLLESHFHAKPFIYTSARVWDGTDADCLNMPHTKPEDTAKLHECPLWLARYPWKTNIAPIGDDASEKATVAGLALPPVPAGWGDGNVWIHQYQGDSVRFPGFTNTADLNRFFEMSYTARGPSVAWVQRKLGLVSDGVYDARMLATVQQFQASAGLTADGIIGPKTFAALAWKS